MEEQNNNQKRKQTWKTVAIIAAASVFAIGLYTWQHFAFKSLEKNIEEPIAALEKQFEEFTKRLDEENIKINIKGVAPSLPSTCVDKQEGTPVITAISNSSGSVGTKLEIEGCNFAGFEGDKNVWIENEQGIKGLMYGDSDSTAKSVKVTLESKLCQKDMSYSGLPCEDWLTLTPGVYKIYVLPWGKQSNVVDFTIY